MKDKILSLLALVALIIILIVGGKPKTDPRVKEASNSTSFSTEPVKPEGFNADKVTVGIPTRVIIPKVSIDLPVKYSRIVRGYWEVFPDTAAWGEGSGLPGSVGNQVIFAHAREGLFLPLKGVSVGDRVYVTTEDDWFSYEVKEITEVFPDQKEVIMPTTDETLTLYTCTGFEDAKRLIVVAKRV